MTRSIFMKVSRAKAAGARAAYIFEQLFGEHCSFRGGFVEFERPSAPPAAWMGSIERLWRQINGSRRGIGKTEERDDLRIARMWLLDTIAEQIDDDRERGRRWRKRRTTAEHFRPASLRLMERAVLAEFGLYFPDMIPRPTPVGPLRELIEKWRKGPKHERVAAIEALMGKWNLGGGKGTSIDRAWTRWKKERRAEGRQRPARS